MRGRRCSQEGERVRAVGEGTSDEVFQKPETAEAVEGVLSGVRFQVDAQLLTHASEESVVVDEIELEHPAAGLQTRRSRPLGNAETRRQIRHRAAFPAPDIRLPWSHTVPMDGQGLRS